MPADLFVSPSAAARVARATAWLGEEAAGRAALVVGASYEAASELARSAAAASNMGAAFGWHCATLGQLAARLAAGAPTELGLGKKEAFHAADSPAPPSPPEKPAGK